MAKKKPLSFSGLGMTPEEDKLTKKWLTDQDVSAKKLLRYLMRMHLYEEKLLKEKPKKLHWAS